MDQGISAILAVVVGSILGFFGNRYAEKTKAQAQQTHDDTARYREQLRTACSTHASNLTSYVWAARSVAAASQSGNQTAQDDLPRFRHAARVSLEQVRLLSNAEAVQKQARLAVRHAYAVMETAAGRPGPRAADYPNGPKASQRFNTAFREFLVESRRELGLSNPEDVFPEP